MRARWISVARAGIVALALFLPAAAAGGAAPEVKAFVGDRAPSFVVQDLDGNRVALDEILGSGKAVLLNFWGLRCGACIEEIGYLNALYDAYGGKGVVFLGINVDGVKGDVVKQLMARLPNVPKYRVVADPDFQVPDLYALEAAPLSIVIGPDGRIVFRHDNFQPGDEKAVEQALLRVLPAGR